MPHRAIIGIAAQKLTKEEQKTNGLCDVLLKRLKPIKNPDEAKQRFEYNGVLRNVEQFILAGASARGEHIRTGLTPLMCAVVNDKKGDIVSLLLNVSNNVNQRQRSTLRSTALHLAAEAGNVVALDLLLKNGATIDLVDELGNSPLHAASKRGRSEAVKALLQAGADVNKKNIYGFSPLQSAAERGCANTAMELIKGGASMSVGSKWNLFATSKTPKSLAKANGHTVVVDLIKGVRNGQSPEDALAAAKAKAQARRVTSTSRAPADAGVAATELNANFTEAPPKESRFKQILDRGPKAGHTAAEEERSLLGGGQNSL